jgi:hypothetical protein
MKDGLTGFKAVLPVMNGDYGDGADIGFINVHHRSSPADCSFLKMAWH